MSAEVITGIFVAAVLAWVWHIARTPARPVTPRPSSLTPARQEEMRRIGAAVGSGQVKGADHDFWSRALSACEDSATSPQRRARRHRSSSGSD